MYDLVIVGSGPAGLSAALAAKKHGLNYAVLEQGVLANTIYGYPRARQLFSTSDEVELDPGAMRTDVKPFREDVLKHYSSVVARERLNIVTGCKALKIVKSGEAFLVETTRGAYETVTVLVAVGGFGRKRKLNVPGEDESRVSYSFVEAEPYAGKDVLVVGGGNSAAEAALFLSEANARVTLSLRRPTLDLAQEQERQAKLKPWVREPLERAASEGIVKILTSSRVVEITPKSAILSVEEGGKSRRIELYCDHIFALIGADPDTKLLEDAGVEIAPDGRPVYDTVTYETNVPGIYVAGHITREMHMKNAINGAQRVVDLMASHRFSEGKRDQISDRSSSR